MAEVSINVNIGLYEVSDAKGRCIARAEGTNFELDGDNDIIIVCNDHYFIENEDWELLQKAKELTQDDWDCIALNEILEEK